MNNPYYGYQNSYQPNYQPTYQQPITQDERIWVQGKLSADAYLVAPNGFVRLWDSLENVFYEKRADQTGRPYMETYEYKKKEYSNTPTQTANYDDRLGTIEKRLQVLEGVLKNGVSESVSDDPTV